MVDEEDKPLDQQIKAETTDLEKRSKQTRVMGVPLAQIIFGGIVLDLCVTELHSTARKFD